MDDNCKLIEQVIHITILIYFLNIVIHVQYDDNNA